MMDDFAMWDNIRRHSFMVARVADLMLTNLHKAATCSLPSRDLVIAGALLHDIAKSKCLNEGCRHAEVGAEICLELGYPHVAEAVANHVIIENFERDKYAGGEFGAIELVFYADKRVCHDEVVSLDSRLEYILGKYAVSNPEYETLIRKNFDMCTELESHFFSHLSITPADVANLINLTATDLAHYPPES